LIVTTTHRRCAPTAYLYVNPTNKRKTGPTTT
jgi:hypothetical protein